MGVACGHSKVDYTQHAQRHGGKGPEGGGELCRVCEILALILLQTSKSWATAKFK